MKNCKSEKFWLNNITRRDRMLISKMYTFTHILLTLSLVLVVSSIGVFNYVYIHTLIKTSQKHSQIEQ